MQAKMNTLSEKELLNITKAPGAQYILVNDHQTLIERNAGYADVRSNHPVTAATTFNAFSITKTVTAAAILKLAEQKKIVLTDYVNPMLNEFHFSYPFTIRDLICHQAGFPDPVPISWIHLVNEDPQFDQNNFIRSTVDKHSGQKYVPSTRFSYSSIGYLLLSRIIEKVSGEPYEVYIRKNILDLLNKNVVLDFTIRDEANHATGYHPRYSFSNLLLSLFLDRAKFISSNHGRWLAFKNFYVNGKAYGGLIGNVRGLANYLQLYLSNKMFLQNETQHQMFSEQKGGMAMGWFTGKLRDRNYVCHAGGGGGYYCEIRIYPELKLASALLRNRSSFGDLRLLDQLDVRILQ